MEKTYNPKQIENKHQKLWESKNLFSSSVNSTSKETYAIMLPPPNVTGSLHMGHAFQHTIMDVLTRYHRAKGEQTLWQPGTDHAGIATQMVVERQLSSKGITRHDLGREKFTEKVWQWKEKSGGTITKQMRRLGTSVDWQKERFTMDAGMSNAVHKVFIQLYNEGLIYRGKRLVNWDPVLQTAISDLEVTATEENGKMYNVKYPFVDEDGFMEIATTRPETILADGALAVNPIDARYKDVIGKFVWVPMTTRKIPIITDDYVDTEFGTGCVKITPAHDFNDWEVGKRHKMEIINLFTPDAKMNENAPKAYQKMDRFDARKQIVKDLDDANLLVKIKPHKLTPPRGDRSGSILEPYLTNQWFVKIAPLAKPAIDAVKNGDIRFVPSNWSKTYFNWMDNIEDWCISRQIWWGHQIPAWYDKDGNIFVADNLEKAQIQAGKDVELTQDNDVLDTWFSSALWPFSTLGWPDKTPDLARFYPTDVLVTGFDIIFFWVARMIMFGLKFMKDVPFKDIYITGLIRDSHGQKMSKSKGNVLDPIDLIDGISFDDLIKKRTKGLMQPQMLEKIKKQTKAEFPNGIDAFGTDALRWTFAALASFGRDINFDLKRVEGYQRFCNKIWNAARFVIMVTDKKDCGINNKDVELSLADKWIISKLQQVEKNNVKYLKQYRLDLCTKTLYDFVWNEYCDWYLEFSKTILNDDIVNENKQIATRRTLVTVLETILRLIHPIMPFITEEIWQKIAPLAGYKNDSITSRKYPEFDQSKIDRTAEDEILWIKEFILGIRQLRSKMNIAPNKKLSCLVQNIDDTDKEYLDNNLKTLLNLGKLTSIERSSINTPKAATALVGKMKVLIPLAGLIDKNKEINRLNNEIEKLKKLKLQFETKLNNEKFISGAPQSVVNNEKEKLLKTENALAGFKSQLKKISIL